MSTLSNSHFTTHGPCISTNGIYGSENYDFAFCLASDFCPPSASKWIDRCHSWPPAQVCLDIIKSGCHFVAIGHKLGFHADDEWRISFSRAEHTLVYSMNHSQFLTYGRLKLFLKEIINNGLPDEEKLLCSYHLKTVIFWAIQQNAIPDWCPQTLLAGFWACFKIILKWVYEGICPNFLSPENNMFLNNVHGIAQQKFFFRLYGLYEQGISFLLHIPSIRAYLTNVLCNPGLRISTDEHSLISQALLDKKLLIEIYNYDGIFLLDLHHCVKSLLAIQQFLETPYTQCQVMMLQKLTATILQTTAFKLYNSASLEVNKRFYIADKRARCMLQLAAKFGFLSDLMYIAMFLYKTVRYREALSLIDMIRIKLAQQRFVYLGNPNPESYIETEWVNVAWTTKMRQTVPFNIKLCNYGVRYIDELMQEQKSAYENNELFLSIPAFTLLRMLEFLCCRHVDSRKAQAALDDLQVLVHYDQDDLIMETRRDISWEILGICQQILGNIHAALYSYQQSLRQIPYNRIETATVQRIRDLHISPLHVT